MRLRSLSEVSAGYQHTCARRASGEVVCWGSNRVGELGDGTTTNSLIPTPVVGLRDAVQLAVGVSSCARRASGAVVCWGGRVTSGVAFPFDRTTPAPVDGVTDAVDLAAAGGGLQLACACLRSGAVACWQPAGFSVDGRIEASLVPGVTDAVQVAAGYGHVCALRQTGGVVCWGDNSGGQLGNGTPEYNPTPTPVAGVVDAIDVAAGFRHSCALLRSGGVLCWGSNYDGQLGDGRASERGSFFGATPVLDLADAVQLSIGGGNHTCATRESGAVVCWGRNNSGAIGDGTMTTHPVPTSVLGF